MKHNINVLTWMVDLDSLVHSGNKSCREWQHQKLDGLHADSDL